MQSSIASCLMHNLGSTLNSRGFRETGGKKSFAMIAKKNRKTLASARVDALNSFNIPRDRKRYSKAYIPNRPNLQPAQP